MVQDRVDGFFVAVHNLKDAFWQACLFHQFSKHQWDRWITLGGFQDECVARCDGRGKHPHWDHGGEVERGNACSHTQSLAHGIHVDARTCRVSVVAFEQFRGTDAVFNHLKAALHVACSVGQSFTVLAGESLGQFVHVVVKQAHELHHHAGATLWVCCSPFWLCSSSELYRLVHFSSRCQWALGLNFAGGWVHDICETA